MSRDNFGLLIAYLLPGFVTLWGVSYVSETIQSWLGGSSVEVPSVGGFLYVTVASISAGLLISAVRWLTLDRLFHHTGISEPKWAFANLEQQLQAFETLVQYHYRYYQFHANMFVAVSFTYLMRLLTHNAIDSLWLHVAVMLTLVILFLGSRDTLQKYYARVGDLLILDKQKRDDAPCRAHPVHHDEQQSL